MKYTIVFEEVKNHNIINSHGEKMKDFEFLRILLSNK